MPPTEPGPLAAAGTYRVDFSPSGTAQLGGRQVPAKLNGLLIDKQRRMVLAELPVWPNLQPATAPPTSRPGAMTFWRGKAYYTARDGSSVMVRDCDGGVTPFVDLRRQHDQGDAAAEAPDLAAMATTMRDTLLVADRHAGTAYEFDLPTAQVVWSWRNLDGIDDVTVTDSGEVYATCDRGIVRLDPYEQATDVFRLRRARSRAKSLAWGTVDGTDVLFIALSTRITILELTTSRPRKRGNMPAPHRRAPSAPIAVRWHNGRLYVGSPTGQAIRVVDTTTRHALGDLPGRVRAYAAFGLDNDGALWITDGLSATGSDAVRPVDHGSARLGPLRIKLDQATDHTLRIRTVGRPTTGGAVVSAEFTPQLTGSPDMATTIDAVLRVPPGATGVTIRLTLRAAPSTSAEERHPMITAVELRVDEPGWIDQLPSIYRHPAAHPELFLDPFLRLARTGIDEVIDALLAMPAQIAPSTAIDDLDGDRWLDWLAGWVDVQLDETMPTDTRREMVAGAFTRHGTRGTAGSLRDLITLELGLTTIEITQPGDLASVWVLGADSAELGLRTMTAAAPPNGSILDSTAVAARSHLIGTSDYGAPLFGDLPNRFNVLVHAALIRCPDDRARLEALIERERPAHTTAHLCVIEPGISVGIQARIGVDTVIGIDRHQHALGGLDGFTAEEPHGRHVLGEGDHEGLVLT